MSLFKNLRGRLILATLLIQTLMLALILWSGEEVVQKNLMERIENRRREQSILLEAALATPMAQADYGAVSDVLWAAQASEGIDYLVMLDLQGRVLARANWDNTQALPHRTRTWPASWPTRKPTSTSASPSASASNATASSSTA